MKVDTIQMTHWEWDDIVVHRNQGMVVTYADGVTQFVRLSPQEAAAQSSQSWYLYAFTQLADPAYPGN